MTKEKPITVASFEREDFIKQIKDHLEGLNQIGQLTRESAQNYLNTLPVTKIKLIKDSVKARKRWLKLNFKSGDILDSEFYEQVHPSINMAISDIGV